MFIQSCNQKSPQQMSGTYPSNFKMCGYLKMLIPQPLKRVHRQVRRVLVRIKAVQTSSLGKSE